MVFLKAIRLCFSDLSQVTDKGLSKLNGCLNHLTKLGNVTLMAPQRSKITDMSLASLRFQKLISLRQLSLKFDSCQQLTNQGIILMT